MSNVKVHACLVDTVREVVAPVRGRTSSLRALLAHAEVHCQRGGPARTALECVACPRVVNLLPAHDRSKVTIRCLWSTEDPITDVMTLGHALVAVSPGASIAYADGLARSHGIRHLLVTTRDDLLGVVCRCDLVPPVLADETVADRMSCILWSLPATATLGDAATLMRERHVGFLPVVEDGELVGVVTRGDLRRAGISDDLLGATACEQCGSHHGVRPHPQLEGIEYCLDCLDRSFTLDDYAALPA